MKHRYFGKVYEKEPGSMMLRQDTRKYFPQAVPRSTLSTSTVVYIQTLDKNQYNVYFHG